MQNFTTTLIATAALWTGALAQLPRECFYVTDMHGPGDTGADLLSNLPTLMAMYKPGMQIHSITALQDSEQLDRLTGLQIDLQGQHNHQKLQLPVVGATPDMWDSQRLAFKGAQPDRISILEDSIEGGICDVVIYEGSKATSLSKDTEGCTEQLKGITETIIRLPEHTPLVGFHGMADYLGLHSLGLIFVDTESSVCQKPLDHSQMDMYKGMGEFALDKAVEAGVTSEEHERAVALEAILAYDSMIKARESAESIDKEIHALNKQRPINVSPTTPATEEDLVELLDRLAKLDNERNPTTKSELKTLFHQLSVYYEDDGEDTKVNYRLPITVAQLRKVYFDLAESDGGSHMAFAGRKSEEAATIIDMTNLLDKLSYHYTTGSGEALMLPESDQSSLIEIFNTMSDFYAFEVEDEDEPLQDELYLIYDELAELFGEQSDFELGDDQINDLYEMIRNGQEIEQKFEGKVVNNFNDLLKMERNQNENKLTKLMSEMTKYEELEEKSRNFLQQEYSMQNHDLESMMKAMSTEQTRLDQIEQLLVESKYAKKEQDKQEIKPKREIPQSLKDDTKVTNQSDNTVEIEHKVDVAVESMIYTFLGVLIVAVVIGVAIGGLCLLCCMRGYQRNQKRRLTESKLSFKPPTLDSVALGNSQEQSNTMGQTNSKLNFHVQQTPLKLSPQNLDLEKGGKNFENPKVLSQLDTEDLATVEVKEEINPAQLNTEYDDEDDDIGNVLTTRGLQFNAPMDRRGTVQKKKGGSFAPGMNH